MRFRLRIGLSFILAAVGGVVWGAVDPAEILRRCETADKRVSYRGAKTAVVNHGGRSTVSVLKVVHLRPDMTRTEFFSPDVLAGIVLIRRGEESWRYSPDGDEWRRMDSCRNSCPCELASIFRGNFALRLLGMEQVAGRPSYVIQAVPRHPREDARRVWVDREHHLALATQVENSRGEVTNSSRYTRIQINPTDISADVFRVECKTRSSKSRALGPPTLAVPSYLPRGYKLVGRGVVMADGAVCAHLTFSNGADLISLFERSGSSTPDARRLDRKLGNTYTWSRAGRVFTLMGDASLSELRKIAESVR